MSPNFILLDAALPDVVRLVTAMVQVRATVDCRSWSRPQEPITEEWWAAAHRSGSQASVLSARRRAARDHPRCVQQVRLAGGVFARRPHRLSWCGLRDAQPTQRSRRTELQQARLQLDRCRVHYVEPIEGGRRRE